MYSAESSKLNEKLKKNNELIESDFISSNNKYTINDLMVKKHIMHKAILLFSLKLIS